MGESNTGDTISSNWIRIRKIHPPGAKFFYKFLFPQAKFVKRVYFSFIILLA